MKLEVDAIIKATIKMYNLKSPLHPAYTENILREMVQSILEEMGKAVVNTTQEKD